MKKAIAVLPLALISVLLSAQAPFPSKNEISQFSSSKTCVVLEDDSFSPFNAFIKKGMKEFTFGYGVTIIALNEKNAIRKYENYKKNIKQN